MGSKDDLLRWPQARSASGLSTSWLTLARKAVRHPQRALLRLVLWARLRRTTLEESRARALDAISARWGVDATELANEYRGSEIARWYQEQLAALQGILGQGRMGTSDRFGCELLYVVVRAARPQVAVETGVLYGASSGHILAAMEANGQGELHSIDLGTCPGEPPYHFLVRPDLMARWHYVVGDIRTELPQVLGRLGQIDMFYHDSLHTFEHMTWEYETAARHLRPGGVLASHDVITAESILGIFRDNAFPAFCRRHSLNAVMARNTGIAEWL